LQNINIWGYSPFSPYSQLVVACID